MEEEINGSLIDSLPVEVRLYILWLLVESSADGFKDLCRYFHSFSSLVTLYRTYVVHQDHGGNLHLQIKFGNVRLC